MYKNCHLISFHLFIFLSQAAIHARATINVILLHLVTVKYVNLFVAILKMHMAEFHWYYSQHFWPRPI